jgi:hypothetical protein
MTAPDGALSDQVLDRLRISAAMAVSIPPMAVQIRMGDTTCLEVRRAPVEGASHRVLPPCAFHRAVTGASRMRRAGERIAMRGIPEGSEPSIEWGLAAGARLLTGGVVRLDADAEWVHAGPVLGDEGHVIDALTATSGLTARYDEALGVAIVVGRTARGDKAASRTVVDALLGVVARVGVADLEVRLCGRTPTARETQAWR